jgi:hypothetical protein
MIRVIITFGPNKVEIIQGEAISLDAEAEAVYVRGAGGLRTFTAVSKVEIVGALC